MKIVVVNGSPKGEQSVTMQYVRFLQKKSPQHEFQILAVCHDAKRLEEDQQAFRAAMTAIQGADIVLWATPVYVFLVPGPYKRFIELVAERAAQEAFRGKYAVILTTSVRFFDHMAHAYLHAISEDLGMQVAGAYSAEMYDLLKTEEQKRLALFWAGCTKAVEAKAPLQRRFAPLLPGDASYAPGPLRGEPRTAGKKIVIISDAEEGSVLGKMVGKVRQCFAGPVEMIDLNKIKMLGGCMGCIRCSFDNVCVYRDADDVCAAYRKLVAADIVIEAATIRDRFVSARWKTFWDRGFFNNHIPIMAGKQIGYLIAGPLQQLPYVRDILDARAQVARAHCAGIITDQGGDSAQLDGCLERLAGSLIECAQSGYVPPPMFPGKAGHLILRDEIWAHLRFVFHADHAYYRRHGLYDFPRRSLKTRASESLVRLMLKLPGFRKQFQARIRSEMVKPLEKAVERA